MLSSELIKDVLKFVITGVIAFGVSWFYNSYRLMPGHNIQLVPVSIKLGTSQTSGSSCAVDQAKLTAAINRTNESTSTPSSPDSYVSYLKVLSPYKLVLQDFVPPAFRPSLEKEEILLCNQPFEPSADITLEAAIMLRESTPYLMKRSCFMLYANVEYPIHTSTERLPVEQPFPTSTERLPVEQPFPTSTGYITTRFRFVEPETLIIREPKQLMFAYAQEDPTAKTKLADLAQKVHKEDIKLSVKCSMLSFGSEIYTEVSGQSYPVSVSFLP
jgi:hypothetical protein